MEYKLLVRDYLSAWRKAKIIRLSGVDTILKPGPLDNNYTFLDEKGKIVYSTPVLNVISIELINNKKGE